VAGSLPDYDPLWLNELQIESMSDLVDNAGEKAPWLEIHNSGPAALNLDGYYLANNYTNGPTQWPFPPGTSLAPGEHKLIWADGEPEESTVADLHTSFRLAESGQLALIRIVNDQPQVTDYLTWPTLGANIGYGGSPDGQMVYRFALHHPTPRGINNEPALRVFINEWMARNSSGLPDPADGVRDDWFELYNAEAFTINLGGFYLTDDTNPTKYRIPNNGRYQIPPGGFLLVWADEQTNQNTAARADLHADFKLSSSPAQIGLYAPDGQTAVDVVTYGIQFQDISEGRYADGATNRFYMTRSTPRSINAVTNYNTPPSFPFIADQFASPGGRTTNINARAIDPDSPPQTLIYAVESGPVGAEINQAGLFRWIVPANQLPGDYLITLRATDNGIPPRSGSTTFTVTIQGAITPTGTPLPLIRSVAGPNGQITFTIDTIAGRTYRVFYSDDLTGAVWTQLDRDFVAANVYASISDILTAPQRFYRVQQVD
jgi:hypothetical protein